ncbi:MAG: hypothetical protein KAS87_00825 [Candidatus Omnitrophica bacterium]|nr:hypothetical protein [Candidatus Omnitrophota bacterium]
MKKVIIAALLVSGFFCLLLKSTYARSKAIEVDFFAMSQCPFATQAENTFIEIKKQLKDKLNFNLYFIADENKGKFRSLHGQAEVEENIRQLIIKKHFPENFFDYLKSRNTDYRSSEWKSHSVLAGLEPKEVEELVKKEGERIFRENIKKARELEVKASPVIFINGEKYEGSRSFPSLFIALRERFSWRERKRLPWASLPRCFSDADCIKTGETGRCLLPATKQAKCSFEKLLDVNLTVVHNNKFNPKIIDIWKRAMPDLIVKKVAHNSPEGKKMVQELGFDVLPIYTLSKSAEQIKDFAFYKRNGMLIEKGDRYILNPDIIGINYYIKREKEDNNLKLFTMSACPFGTEAENEILSLAEEKDIKVEIYYIAFYDEKKGWESLHGLSEAEENIRQLCVRKYYPEKYFDYILERNENIKSSFWEKAAINVGVDDKKIQQCQYDEGKELLKQNAKLAQELKINASPTILWENNKRFNELGELKDSVEIFKNVKIKQRGRCQ